MELHASAKQIQRSKGRSSVAAAAYRSGICLTDDRTGLVHDYTKKSGVEFCRIYTPDNAPPWAADRQALWNACEAKENRSNSCTARELEIGFPHEFNAMQRREAGNKICRELMQRYGCAVDISYHNPSQTGDQRNYHAHILFTTRGFVESTKDGWSAKKYREFNNDRIVVDGEKTTRGKQEIVSLRDFTAKQFNLIAERDGIDLQVEHLSFSKRGIDREATQHRGNTATQMERNGKRSRIEDMNEHRQRRNSERAMQHAQAARDSANQANPMSDNTEQFKDASTSSRTEPKDGYIIAREKMDKRHAEQHTRLDEKQNKDPALNTVIAEMNTIERRLESTGIRKVVRDVFRQTATDEEKLRRFGLSVREIKKQHGLERASLYEQQTKERERLEGNSKTQNTEQSKNSDSGRSQADRGESGSRGKTLNRRETDRPEPTPPPPREAIKIAQDWGEKTGQNAEHIKQATQSGTIDTRNMAMPRDEKPKEFEQRRGAEYDNVNYERSDPTPVKPEPRKETLAEARERAEKNRIAKENMEFEPRGAYSDVKFEQSAPVSPKAEAPKKESLAEARARAKQERTNDNPEPKLKPKGLNRDKGLGL